MSGGFKCTIVAHLQATVVIVSAALGTVITIQSQVKRRRCTVDITSPASRPSRRPLQRTCVTSDGSQMGIRGCMLLRPAHMAPDLLWENYRDNSQNAALPLALSLPFPSPHLSVTLVTLSSSCLPLPLPRLLSPFALPLMHHTPTSCVFILSLYLSICVSLIIILTVRYHVACHPISCPSLPLCFLSCCLSLVIMSYCCSLLSFSLPVHPACIMVTFAWLTAPIAHHFSVVFGSRVHCP